MCCLGLDYGTEKDLHHPLGKGLANNSVANKAGIKIRNDDFAVQLLPFGTLISV